MGGTTTCAEPGTPAPVATSEPETRCLITGWLTPTAP